MNLEQSTSSHKPVAESSPENDNSAEEQTSSPDSSQEAAAESSAATHESSLSKPAEDMPASHAAAAAPAEAESAEAAATDTPETETPASDPPATETRPRVQLNPTVDPSQAKAVPSPTLAAPRPAAAAETSTSETAATDSEESDAVAEAQAVQSSTPAPPPPSGPVELPPANEDLDADIEAELAAAMAGDEQTAAPAVAPAAGAEPVTEEDIEPGTKLKGRVQSIQKESILLDVGFRSSAMIPLRQFEGRKQPQLGQELEIVVDRYDAEDGLLLASLPRAARSAGNWDEVALGQVVECMVKKSNKGGLEVSVNNLRGFMPASQVDLGFVSSLDEFVGQKLTAKIIEVKPEKRNLVVSRRAYMQDEREEIAKDLWANIEVGQNFTGTVKTIKDYGAFIDIGGIDGLLHVAEMSWTRVNHPRDILKEGQQIDVQIISVDKDKKKISLSLKQLKKNPWDDCVARYPVESVVRGKVSNIANFGAFVEIEEGVEGLIHISELDYRRINKVTDVLTEGQEVEAKVVSIDPERKRIGLSLKALKAKPEPAQKPKDEDLAPSGGESYQRKRKGPLKGGTGSDSGPLFG